jgi:hypothetical protein
MLDSYIIDRIRRERERKREQGRRERTQIPLHIPSPPERRHERDNNDDPNRGSIVIDFHV